MYLTLEHLIDRYGAREIVEVANDRTSSDVDPADLKGYAEDASPTSADILIISEFVNKRIEDAIAFSMSFVHTVYDVTEFTEENVPRDLRAVTAAVARYYLHENRMNQRVHQGYQDALVWLQSRPNLGSNSLNKKHPQSGVKISGSGVSKNKSTVFTDESEKRFTEGYNL